jgi:hypothetical protein
MMRDIDEVRVGLNDQDLHAYCEAWREWCRTRGFYLPPKAKNILARMQPSKVRQPPDAELSANMQYFNMAVHALCDMDPEQSECFLLLYYCQAQNIKRIAYDMKIGRQTFYDRANRFARRAYSMSHSLKRMSEQMQKPQREEPETD